MKQTDLMKIRENLVMLEDTFESDSKLSNSMKQMAYNERAKLIDIDESIAQLYLDRFNILLGETSPKLQKPVDSFKIDPGLQKLADSANSSVGSPSEDFIKDLVEEYIVEEDYVLVDNFLRNDYITDVKLDDIIWASAEHAFQSLKSDSSNYKDNIYYSSIKEAVKIGRDVEIDIYHWNSIKLSMMKKVLLIKFEKSSYLFDKLNETYPKEIKMISEKDLYWGINKEGDGENHLGKLLMSIRDTGRV